MHSDKTNKRAQWFENGSQVIVKQTAAECSKLLRLSPLIIANLIPQCDKIWLLYIDSLRYFLCDNKLATS